MPRFGRKKAREVVAPTASYEISVQQVRQKLETVGKYVDVVRQAAADAADIESGGKKKKKNDAESGKAPTIFQQETSEADKEVENSRRCAWEEVKSAQRLLSSMEVAACQRPQGSEVEESRRLEREQLSSGFADASSHLEEAVDEYEAAIARLWSPALTTYPPSTAASTVPSATSSPCPTFPAMMRHEEDTSAAPSGGRMEPLLIATDRVTADDAEAALHGEIVTHYATQTARINGEFQGINRVMQDLATVTHTQGAMLDNIEANMAAAESYADQGTSQINDMAGRVKRKWRCVIVSLVFVTIFCIVMIVVFAMRAFRN